MLIVRILKGLIFPIKTAVNLAVRAIEALNRKELYGLDHAVLSVELPPTKGMWMNLGYWKNTNSFPEACEALLDQVLIAARLLDEDRTPIAFSAETDSMSEGPFPHEIRLIDVGIGCGDQSLYLTRQCFRSTEVPTTASGTREASSVRPLFDSYVGLTIVQSQADFARDRLSQPGSTIDPERSFQKTPNVKVFAADAAEPASWEEELKTAVFGPSVEQGYKSTKQSHTWLLALDTLYHFRPSRDEIFRCAYQDMQASIMAFDLLLSDQATLWERFILRMMCLLAGLPYGNFVTKEGYRKILTQAGYDRDLIEMRDISGHVFSGIAGFLRKKDAELSRYGMTVGKFKGPAKAFDWWAQTGVVRGVIVVARRSEMPGTE
ncbi:hypothetical protein BDW66DRAFT_166393 [Aspergillus desertorum]